MSEHSPTQLHEWALARWMRLWRWVAVFACARLNARLWDEQHTYIVIQDGETKAARLQQRNPYA